MRKNISPLILLNFLAFVVLTGCGGSDLSEKYPIEKRYWTPEDYDKVVWTIEFDTPEGEAYPKFSDPEKGVIIKKLTDHQNYIVILNDPKVGLNHKKETSQAFFDQYQKMSKLYNVTDRQDKLVYPEELVAIEKFGLGLQILYFKSGNDNIVAKADNPNDPEVLSILRSNEQIVIGNYNYYLDEVNREDSFSDEAINSFCEGIDTYFPKLIETFPMANYSSIKTKAELMLKKAKSEKLKKSLTDLINRVSPPATAEKTNAPVQE